MAQVTRILSVVPFARFTDREVLLKTVFCWEKRHDFRKLKQKYFPSIFLNISYEESL
jgi:hypothetical protein